MPNERYTGDDHEFPLHFVIMLPIVRESQDRVNLLGETVPDFVVFSRKPISIRV